MSTETELHDHFGCRQKAIDIAEQLCNQRGVRFTAIRREVLELIWESHRAVKAYDLLDKIKTVSSSAKPTTVYRALDFLLEQGLIHKVESLNAFIGCSYSDRLHKQLLLTCICCQNIEERPAELVMQAIANETQLAGFSIRHQTVEIHGMCAKCTNLADTQNLSL